MIRMTLPLLLFSLLALPASASIVPYGSTPWDPPPVTAVMVLDFKSAGTISGCAYWTGSGTALGAPCPFGTGLDSNQEGGSTTTFGALSITTLRDLAIVFHPDEPENDQTIQVDKLVLAFQNPATGAVIYSTTLATPFFVAAGHNAPGYIFALDYDQALAAHTAIASSLVPFSNVRISLGAQLSLAHQGQNDTFYLWKIENIVPVPEPATFGLMGSALVGLGILLKRRRNK